MIRVRYLWLRPETFAEGLAREGGPTRLAYLEMCALVSEEPERRPAPLPNPLV
jgi:hypothetical protein